MKCREHKRNIWVLQLPNFYVFSFGIKWDERCTDFSWNLSNSRQKKKHGKRQICRACNFLRNLLIRIAVNWEPFLTLPVITKSSLKCNPIIWNSDLSLILPPATIPLSFSAPESAWLIDTYHQNRVSQLFQLNIIQRSQDLRWVGLTPQRGDDSVCHEKTWSHALIVLII